MTGPDEALELPVPAPAPPESAAMAPRGPWGPAATIGFTLLLVLAFLLVELVVVLPYLFFRGAFAPGADPNLILRLEADGLLVALTELVATPVVLGAIALAVWLRKGPPLREYLALTPVPRPVLLRWLLATMGVAAAFDIAAYLAGRPDGSDWMPDVVRSAVFVPLLALALVVLAPLLEETFFRGFLFEGLRHSRIGTWGAVLVAAVLWGLLHLQYGWFYITQIVVLGVLLGAARVKTGSLVTPIAMHALVNTAATLQALLETSKAADP